MRTFRRYFRQLDNRPKALGIGAGDAIHGELDRQAADAVRGRIDWKYTLCLELEDAGFNYNVLSEFRDRLVAGGHARTDSMHVLAVIEVLNRLELVGRTLQAMLKALRSTEPFAYFVIKCPL